MEKNNMRTLLNSMAWEDMVNDKYTYEDYKVWAECMEEFADPNAEDDEDKFFDMDSDEFRNWCGRESRAEYENDKEDIKDIIDGADSPCLIEGSLGLWDGRHIIESKYFEDLDSAIDACISGSINDVKVELDLEHGTIEVSAYHHDGCNTFTIELLSKKGEERAYNHKDSYGNVDVEPKKYKFVKDL